MPTMLKTVTKAASQGLNRLDSTLLDNASGVLRLTVVDPVHPDNLSVSGTLVLSDHLSQTP